MFPTHQLIRRAALTGAAIILLAGCQATATGAGTPATQAGNNTAAPAATVTPTATPTDAPAITEAPSDVELTPEPEATDPATYQAKVGEVVSVTSNGEDNLEVLVDKVSTHRSYGSGYLKDTPDKGNVYLQAFVTYKALADGASYNPYDWSVFVDGTAVDNFTFTTEGPKPELGSGDLPKGRTAKGWLVYEVPAQGTVVMSYGGSFSNDAPIFEVTVRK